MQVILVLIAISILIGLLGKNSRFGFWGNFFASLLFTPLIGLLLVIASTGNEPTKTSR